MTLTREMMIESNSICLYVDTEVGMFGYWDGEQVVGGFFSEEAAAEAATLDLYGCTVAEMRERMLR